MKPSPVSLASRFAPVFIAVSLLVRGNAPAAVPVVATGANVDESRVEKTIFVDPAHTEAADDDKHGQADAPFATLGFACQVATKAKDANVGIKMVLAAGTYREAAEIRPPVGGRADTDAPLIIEAAEREQAVIDGADTEGWSPSTWKIEDNHWTHPWPFRRSAPVRLAGTPAGTTGESYRRGDLIFVNGTPLRQVNAAVDLTPGCFWGMLPVPVGGRHGTPVPANVWPVIVVQPPADTELPGAVIQVGVRACGLTIAGRRNVVVRGLLIQHAAEPGGAGEQTAGLVLAGCANVLVEDVLSQWNDGAGLAILGGAGGSGSTDFTLRRVRLLHNGGSGLNASNLRNLLSEDSETSFNNFRGEWADWIDPQGPAGVKAIGVAGSTWRRQHVVGNLCRGLWWAGESTDVTVEDAVVRDNYVSGMFVENDRGPVLVRHSLVVGTKGHASVRDGHAFCAGLSLGGTPDVTLESNVVADNTTAQLGIAPPPGEPVGRAEHHVYRHNVFSCADADASLYRLPAFAAEMKSAPYYTTLDSEENCFWNAVKTDGFDGYVYRAGNRKTGATYASHLMKLEDWQSAGQKEATSAAINGAKIEVGSIWRDPLFVDPTEGDYRLKQASPVQDWGLPSDEAAAGQ